MTTIDPLLKVDEVAAMLCISRPSLYRRIADGTIPPPIKLGGLSRWSRADVLAALDLRKQARGSARP